MSQLLEDLQWLREFLTPDTWVKGGMAYDSHDYVNRQHVPVTSDKAVCFCITGAICRRIPITEEERVEAVRIRVDSDMPDGNEVLYSPNLWINPRRRAIIHALGFKTTLEEQRERYIAWKKAEINQLHTDEHILAGMEMNDMWSWNDGTTLTGVHSRLDHAIEKVRDV